jgi:hypothetical protein
MLNGQRDHPMIISTLYLPETTVNVRYQCVLLRSVCAGQTNCSVMIGTVRWWVLLIASSQVGAWRQAGYRARRNQPRVLAAPRPGRSPGWPIRTLLWQVGPQGVASHRPPLRATTRQPRGRAIRRRSRSRRGRPPGCRVVGLRQVDGTPHGPTVQDRRQLRRPRRGASSRTEGDDGEPAPGPGAS